MRQTLDLTWASLKMLLRDAEAFMLAALAPILFLLVFSLYDLTITPVGDLSVGGAALDYFDFVLPGVLAMGLMNFTMVGIAGSVARFRETQVLRRLTATPVSPLAFIAGQVFARLAVSVLQVLLLLGTGVLLGGTIVGNVAWVVLLATLGNLVFLALGFAVAGRTPSVDAANNLAGLLTLPLMFLSGMFFPIASLPGPVRTVAEWLPMTPLIDGMRAVALEGVGIAALAPEVALLTIWVGVSFAVARLSFRMGGPARQRVRRRRRLPSGAVAPQRRGGRAADLLERVVTHDPEAPGQPALGHGVQAVGVDDRGLVDPGVGADRDLDREPARLRRDLGHGDVRPDVEHLVPRHDQDRARLAAYVGEPDLSPPHASSQDSAPSQSSSSASGRAR
jgi:ABC-type multidrug transport system permease subunit